MDKELILDAILKQKEGLDNNPLRSVKNRKEALKRLYKNIKLYENEIIDALKKDLNKSATESYMCEIGMVLSEITFMLKHLGKYAKIKKVRTPIAQFHSKSFKMPCPYGQILIISPWNYPFMLAVEPLVDAISAGNNVVLKPSETSSHISAVIDKIMKESFINGEVITVLGGRDKCSFLLDQDFDYIFFTGSTRVGKIVLEKASQYFTPVTLELGGKSPCIVDDSANIELSAKRIVFGKFLNCGQTCVAPDYVYCASSIKDKLIKEIERQIVLQYSVDPINNEDYPKMINQRQFDNTLNLVNKDELLFGGKSNSEKLKIEPTLLNSTFESEAMKEEIFGPILPIVTFDNIDEAIKNINSLSKPLALYIFSSKKKNIKKVLSLCNFGGGCVNDTIIHLATSNMGFGGLKQSGMGSYHGKSGFDTFSHYKSIVDKKKWIDLPMRYQPYSKSKDKLIRMFLK